MRAHAHAHNTDFGDLAIATYLTGTDLTGDTAQHFLGAFEIIAAYRKRKRCLVILPNVLNNHVHFNVGIADRLQNPQGATRGIRHAGYGQFRSEEYTSEL